MQGFGGGRGTGGGLGGTTTVARGNLASVDISDRDAC